ncbi:rhomboid family intramembrane serine protease [Sulfolobales archaeon HS-7]|nr:rhomboid family intramembrane serine protease [Sulfolobales archaeon HS-7]
MKSTLVLAFLILLGFIIGRTLYFLDLPLYLYLIQINCLVERGYVYQLFTSIFVTSSISDAVFNFISMLVIYQIFKSYANRLEYFVFLLSGIMGNIVSLLYGPLSASAGASGGIFGILAYYVTDQARKNWDTYRSVAKNYIFLLILVFIISNILPKVDILAHTGGVVCGILMNYAFPVTNEAI